MAIHRHKLPTKGMMKPTLEEISHAYATTFTADKFFVGSTEYRLTTMADEPALAWSVWASDAGDLIVDKKDGKGFSRPLATKNEGYLMISILRAEPRTGDRYLRRRLHEWIAHAFCGPPPGPTAVVEHFDDDPSNNSASNITWSTHANNRKTKAINDRSGLVPATKMRKLPVRLQVVRDLQKLTGKKGIALAAFVEELIKRAIEDGSGK